MFSLKLEWQYRMKRNVHVNDMKFLLILVGLHLLNSVYWTPHFCKKLNVFSLYCHQHFNNVKYSLYTYCFSLFLIHIFLLISGFFDWYSSRCNFKIDLVKGGHFHWWSAPPQSLIKVEESFMILQTHSVDDWMVVVYWCAVLVVLVVVSAALYAVCPDFQLFIFNSLHVRNDLLSLRKTIVEMSNKQSSFAIISIT